MKPASPQAETRKLPRESDAYLRRLGERVRMLRNQRGMSRKVLARQAKVSERYIAQLESGLGNCSIVLLRRIARAIGLPVTQLVHDGSDPPLDFVLLSQFLERLSPAELGEARRLLSDRFRAAGADDPARRRRIALIGLRGGGKSTLGMLLAEQLGVPFVELNREIERRAGASLGEIFDMFGQEAFRRAEREALDDILNRHEAFVVATSGSIVTEPGTLEMLLSSCFTVWVRAEPAEHMKRVMAQGDMRPMANSARAMDDLISILKSREPLYARAEATVTTTGKTPEQNLGELLRVIAPPVRSKEPAIAG
ncbi:helix-turn-helix transcriptional regulator [Undibacter mobilis]|uniref:Shikimate kinase n=1 Tax=Undibacter mobilis TaxID=2292256 RepID=A0A371BCB8_9BRAD|nr:helix-turn-helix transcriptional regulator [Undibacter mobilis]RDV05063.1 helix-turn-helix domain-containing protein [Undibacter mobilis]